MKKAIILFLTVLSFYYFLFMKGEKVINSQFLTIDDNGQHLKVSINESSKYIKNYSIDNTNDSTIRVTIFTTSIYNPFARRTPEIDIRLAQKIKIIQIADHVLKRKIS